MNESILEHEYLGLQERNQTQGNSMQEGQVFVSTPTNQRAQQPSQVPGQDLHLLITGLLQHLEKTSRRSTSFNHTFNGRDYENPLRFLTLLEEYFQKEDVKEDQDKVAVLRNHLGEKAKTWYRQYDGVPISYGSLKDRLLRRFDGPETIAAAKSRLYGDKQRDNEDSDVFITTKRNLFQRLEPNLPEEVVVQIVTEQLRPDIKSRLRGSNIRSVEDLIIIASQIEQDLREIKGQKPPQTQPWRSNPVKVEQKSVPQFQPCKHCGGRHYSEKCFKHLNSKATEAREGIKKEPTSVNRSLGNPKVQKLEKKAEKGKQQRSTTKKTSKPKNSEGLQAVLEATTPETPELAQ